jgi:hypothetical protein
MPAHVEPARLRQLEIDHYEVGAICVIAKGGLFTVGGFDDAVALVFE